MKRKQALLGLAAAVFFSLLYILGVFEGLGNGVYDLFLRVRPEREPAGDVIFLDVDDNAIAFNGVFPWPRSITADALLRLKEYGARIAIFDIEYIDKGPQGVDSLYLNQGLGVDFNRSFSEINSTASDIFYALQSGNIKVEELDELSPEFFNILQHERDSLFSRAQGIARDNDKYLIQASALFGKSWATLNLGSEPLPGEQAERRAMAEERFSYPIRASEKAFKGKYTEILPALPGFAMAVQGAGFTNVEIDRDGIRRRIDLAQNIHDHWYLQLAFAPLIHYLGNPEIELDKRGLLIKGAKIPGALTKDIAIPLDGQGRMMLDWPRTDYFTSYQHISFYQFSLLEQLEAELESYFRTFAGNIDIHFFAQFDPSLLRIPFITAELEDLFDRIHAHRTAALENCSDEDFAAFVDYRNQSRALLGELLGLDPAARVNALIPELVETYPESGDAITGQAQDLAALTEALKINLDRYEVEKQDIESKVKDKFCILGRTDTGTTDIGANPFHGEYVNVGTHGVVLDMILSETFITPIAMPWIVLFTLAFVFVFFLFTGKISPVPRAVTGFSVTLGLIAASAALFRFTGVFFSPLLVTFSMIGGIILREIVSYAGSEREKQFIRKAFSTYVSNDIVKEIIADPSRLQLGGTKRHMSAIFTDIQGFSSISEKLDPENLVSLLNRYLTSMSDAILEEMGTIDKYEGDAIIAFFGAPVEIPDHAIRACASAIAMKRIEVELNRKIMEDKLSPSPLYTRIGINTGSMVAGNMGTGNKMNYTIMGNAVNLAARLEGVNKQYGTWALASHDTISETGDLFLTRKLDRVRVVGIHEPVRLYEVLDTRNGADPKLVKLVETFQQALDCFENRRWKEAQEGFRESLAIEGKGPSAKYLERTGNFLIRPPREDWDGVYNLTEK